VSAHVTDRQLADFRRGGLAAAEIVALDAHLSACPDCRGRAAASLAPSDAGLGPAAAEDDRHLDDEELGDYVDGSSVSRAAIERHLALCPDCAATVDDLRELRRAIAGSAIASRPARWMWPAAAAAVVILGVSAALWPRASTAPPTAPRVAESRQVINDGRTSVVIASNTIVAGLDGLSPDERATIAAALADGRLPVADDLRRVRGEAGRLMGSPAGAADFSPLTPVATGVESTRPQFRWSPLAGARGYIVTIVDEQLRPIAQSPVVHAVEWQPSLPLNRGGVYLWQVRALLGNTSRTAPAPPQPEARFFVLNDQAAAEAASLRARAGDSNLAGILLARFGLMEDAAAALAKAAAGNPANATLGRLAQAARTTDAPAPDRR